MSATETQEAVTAGFAEWAIVELMGHVKMAGYVTEAELFGSKLARIDIPGPDDKFVTQYFGGSSVYRITPTTEEIARAVAKHNSPAPVHRWELAQPKQIAETFGMERDDDFEEPDDE